MRLDRPRCTVILHTKKEHTYLGNVRGVFRSEKQRLMDAAMTAVRDMLVHSLSEFVSLWTFIDFMKKHNLWATSTVED